MTNPYGDRPAKTGNPYGDKLLALARQGLEQPAPFTPTTTDRVRSVAQGATLGFADEIEAGARQIIPGGRGYEELRDDLRSRTDQFRAERPIEALSLEMGGAALPTAALAATGIGAPGGVAVPATTAARVGAAGARLATMGAAEGAIAGAGYSEADDFSGVLRDSGTGAAVGAVVSPVVGAGLHAAGRGVAIPANALMQWARRSFGDAPATAVAAEVRRLAGSTGKTPDEVIADVADGRLLVENQTLAGVLRAYRSQAGEAAETINEQLPALRNQRRDQAAGTLSEQLDVMPGLNTFKAFTDTDAQYRAAERELYTEAFSSGAGVIPGANTPSSNMVNTMTDIVQRMPTARRALSEIYDNDTTIAPLYRVEENGALVFLREPTSRDAELMRRSLNDSATKAYRDGNGSLGEVFSDAEDALRKQINGEFPLVQQARETAALRRQMRDTFKEGRKAFSMNTDELSVMFDGLNRDAAPEAVQAFRMGVADAAREQIRRSPTAFTRMADPTRKQGEVLRTVLPEMTPQQFEQLAQAGSAEDMFNKVFHNSMTAPEQAARQQIGSVGSVEDVAGAVRGSLPSIGRMALRAINDMMPQNLNDAQRAQVVEYLFESDPQRMRQVLTGEIPIDRYVDRVAAAVQYLGGVGRLGATTQMVQGVTANAN